MNYSVIKYRGKWAVLDSEARVYYFIGAGLEYCRKRADELNRGA